MKPSRLSLKISSFRSLHKLKKLDPPPFSLPEQIAIFSVNKNTFRALRLPINEEPVNKESDPKTIPSAHFIAIIVQFAFSKTTKRISMLEIITVIISVNR
jgi:hypothetical protein